MGQVVERLLRVARRPPPAVVEARLARAALPPQPILNLSRRLLHHGAPLERTTGFGGPHPRRHRRGLDPVTAGGSCLGAQRRTRGGRATSQGYPSRFGRRAREVPEGPRPIRRGEPERGR